MSELEVLQQHWLALTSLAVALIGGVPGILSVWKEWRARPQISAYLRHLNLVKVHDESGRPIVGLILSLSIGNKGKDAIVPLAYQLECKIGGRWMRFDSTLVPQDATYIPVGESPLQQRQGQAISRKAPAIGLLASAAMGSKAMAVTAAAARRSIFILPEEVNLADVPFNGSQSVASYRQPENPPARLGARRRGPAG